MDALAAAAALASAAANATSDAPPARPLPSGNQAPHKGRKVLGRREEVAVHYAISHTEDDAVIRQRLLTRTTTTRGEPPLKKLLKKFISFGTEIEKEAENYVECEKLYKSLLQELSTFELPLLKTKAVVDANKREQESFKELEAELNQQIIQAQQDIEELKVLLEESKVERQHKEECEAIRRLIGAQPPRSETQKALDELERELSILEAENMAASKTLELRKKQFALLLHVIDDLQSTIEEQKNAVEEQKVLVDDQKNSIDERTVAEQDLVTVEPVVDINNSAEQMQVDGTS